MILFIALALLVGFAVGWVCKDYSWVKICKNKLVKQVDGKFYVVREVEPALEDPHKDIN
jgi:hypothetical protein